MNIFYDMLAPGGLLVATNVDAANPIQEMLDYVLDWNLIYRSGAQLKTRGAGRGVAGPGSRLRRCHEREYLHGSAETEMNPAADNIANRACFAGYPAGLHGLRRRGAGEQFKVACVLVHGVDAGGICAGLLCLPARKSRIF